MRALATDSYEAHHDIHLTLTLNHALGVSFISQLPTWLSPRPPAGVAWPVHPPSRTNVLLPTGIFWLPAVVGELMPNKCMGINYRCPIPHTQQVHGHPPQVPPPTHSDLRPPHCLYYCGHLLGTRLPSLQVHVLLSAPLVVVISRSGNSIGSCLKLVYVKAGALHA